MKAIKLLFTGLFFLTLSSQAQVSVNVNIGAPPAWGPVGYTEARYYYIPDIEVYYDIPTSMFIYFSNGGWIRTPYLPYHYRHYDLYGAYKVCLEDYGPNPYVYYKKHKVKYYHGYHGPVQRTIGVRPRVVYNGPRDGYYREREYRNNDREYYRNNDRRENQYRNDFRNDRQKGNGNGHEPRQGHGNGHGNGGGNGHGRGKRG